MIEGTITLTGLTLRQREIADALWAADCFEDLDLVFARYGQEAVVIHDLMLIEALDQQAQELSDMQEAAVVLDRFR